MTTDNAANMIKAAEILKIRHIPCFSHTLNLIVDDCLGLKNKDKNLISVDSECETLDEDLNDCLDPVKAVEKILKHLKEIVTYFRCSTLAKEKLDKSQKLIQEGKVLCLIQSCPTRWNSVFYMIKRALGIIDALSLTI